MSWMVLLTEEGAALRTVGDFLGYARLESARDNYAALLSEQGVDEVRASRLKLPPAHTTQV